MTRRKMATDDILALPSVEGGVSSRANYEAGYGTVREVIEYKEIDDDYHFAITDSMRENGINIVPVHVGAMKDVFPDYYGRVPDGMGDLLGFGNGHHRVAIAVELGLDEMLVTDDRADSGWNDNSDDDVREVW